MNTYCSLNLNLVVPLLALGLQSSTHELTAERLADPPRLDIDILGYLFDEAVALLLQVAV